MSGRGAGRVGWKHDSAFSFRVADRRELREHLLSGVEGFALLFVVSL